MVHTLGAGTDASATWLRAIMVVTGVPIVFLFLRRVLPAPAPRAAGRGDGLGRRAGLTGSRSRYDETRAVSAAATAVASSRSYVST